LIAISTGEPAGIGPDICVKLAAAPYDGRIVFLGDPGVLRERARQIGVPITLRTLAEVESSHAHTAGEMQLYPIPARAPVTAGVLDRRNAPYVIEILRRATTLCLERRCDALVTAPVQKSIIVDAGIPFTGHTEFLAAMTQTDTPVMLLARPGLRVALATTHVPLRAVPDSLSREHLHRIIEVLHTALEHTFAIEAPRILVLGLNPHAGEGGTLGTEERDIIAPVITAEQAKGRRIIGPRPADTAFTPESLAECDAVLAMYHDQGLTPLKAQGFGEIVNVTLGLPIIRTSVDHGTALGLAGTGRARADSLHAALALATELALRAKSR
jgi:4-hydroxythreonine-4-phosphate dehydrogenase